MDGIVRDQSVLPYFETGKVVKGFGRGSKEIGIPTANYPASVVERLPPQLESGVYYGWAQVEAGPVYPMVMSIGWNPHYQNKERSMETHILHVFPEDFYGAELRVCVAGYIREERKFPSLESLIEEIQRDIATAREKLKLPAMADLAERLAQINWAISKH